jgi:beta-galactosidase
VWLRTSEQIHIPTYGTFVTTDKNLVKVQTKVEMPPETPSNGDSIVLVTTIKGHGEKLENKLAIPVSGEYEQVFTLNDPKLWSHKEPNLYKAISRLEHNGRILDEYETIFGIRSVEFHADKGCLINGERVKLNGVCLHHDGGAVGAAVPKKLGRRRLILLKEMGCNAIRTAHNPPDPALLELCDELGFYVMDEAFDEWAQLKWKVFGSNTHESRGYSEWFKENYKADLEAMLYRDRNHPSVIIWSIGNEVPEQLMPDGHILAKELQDICRKADPTRLCTQGNDQICAEPKSATEEFLNTLDVVGYNYTGRWRTRAETLYDDDKRANPNRIILGTENPSAAGIRGDYRMDIPYSPWRRPYFSAPVNVGRLLRCTMTHDYVAGDFMWTGIDHLGESHWPHRSSSSGVIDTCGFPKDHYYFYKSIWNREKPMIHLFPHRNLEDVEEGTVLPVLCYTNCTYAELFVNGKPYGKKSYSYPLYGMTETYGHFDTPPVIANTDDLFLSWDVPFEKGKMEAVGYIDGKEVCRFKTETAKAPAGLAAVSDENTLSADGRDIAHIEISLVDENGIVNPVASNTVSVKIDGPAELIGLDNGMPSCHESFKGSSMSAHGGKLLAIIRAKKEAGTVTATIASGSMEPLKIEYEVKKC